MIRTKLFARHYLVTAIIMVLFMVIGFLASHLIMRYAMEQNRPRPAQFFAKIINEINPSDRISAITRMQSFEQKGPMFDIYLVDEHGTVLYPQDKTLTFEWDDTQKPFSDYEEVRVETGDGFPTSVIRLPGEPAQYLVSGFNKGRMLTPPFFIFTFGFLLLSTLLGAGLALYLLFRTMQGKINLADSVIDELKKGNLKARFPITRKDEVGQVMIRFNKMADEIEHLVEQLKATEQSRMSLLQELAHDLRTPVASLKNLLETIFFKRESVSKEVQEEFSQLSLKEVEYIEHLVEDLLLLAQVSEPRYQANTNEIILDQILDDESESIKSKYTGQISPIKLIKSFPPNKIKILGNAHLIRRLVRNAMDNAFSFAKNEVKIELESGDKFVTIRIEDDGAGFSLEALGSYGKRQVSRMIGEQTKGRLSIGLGSVIMKAVVDAHRGQLKASNRYNSKGHIIGGAVEIKLPTT